MRYCKNSCADLGIEKTHHPLGGGGKEKTISKPIRVAIYYFLL